MIKPYGFKTKDLAELAEFIKDGNMSGISLTEGFKRFADKTGKANGSVRNLYYALAKLSQDDKEFTDKFLNGVALKVEKPQRFSDEEKGLIDKLKEYKERGVSVRKATFLLAGGDAKKALRLQNKYRSKEKTTGYTDSREEMPQIAVKDEFLRQKLKREIDALVDRIALSVRKENETLKKEALILREENSRLYKELAGRKRSATAYFEKAARENRITGVDG